MNKITFWIATRIATKEREGYLYECIESILNQTNSNWELIISDDNSPININIKKYIKDKRIKVFTQEKSLWIFKNFNFCLHKTNTELFLPLWDDDILEKDFVEKILNYYNENKNKEIDLISFNFYLIESNWYIYWESKIKDEFKNKWINQLNKSVKEMYSLKMAKMFFCAVVKVKSLKKLWWYPDYWMPTDWYLIFLFSLNFNIWFLEDKILRIRHHKDNAGLIKNIDKFREETIKVYEIIRKEYYELLNKRNKDLFDKIMKTFTSDYIYLLITFKKYWRYRWIRQFFITNKNIRSIIIVLFGTVFWKNIHTYFMKFANMLNYFKYLFHQYYYNIFNNK